MLKEVPSYDRPREKAIKYGVKSLSMVELMAIVLRTGSKDENVIELAKKIIYSCDEFRLLNDLSLNELTKIKGIGPTKAITILAAIEMGIRIIASKNEIVFYHNPKEIFDYYYPKVKLLTKEHLYALFLNTKGVLIKEQLITQGTISSSLFDGKDILKWALKLSASAIILVHNHPSGDPTPSMADLKATTGFVNQAKIMEIMVLDHIIIGNDFYSMKANTKIFKVF